MDHSVDIKDHITTVTLNRGAVNALDLPSILFLEEAFRTASAEKALLLTGQGKAFCAGVDTKAYISYTTAERHDLVRAITRMVSALLHHPAPTIAALNGHALGGGFGLMLCTDYRLACEDPAHQFGLPEAAAGVPYPAGPSKVIAHELPGPLLRYLTLTSKSLGSSELLSHQVIDEIVPAEDLRDKAVEAAKTLLAQPAFRIVKQQMRQDLMTAVAQLAASGEEPFLSSFG